MADAVVPLPGLRNVRDLGGYPARDGASVRRGVVYRSELLAGPAAPEMCGVYDDSARSAYLALGLRTVLDLRTPDEEAEVPSAWAAATGAQVVRVPVAEGGNLLEAITSGAVPATTPEGFGRFYTHMFRRRAAAFGTALAVLAEPDRLPAVIHCAAGKDRTGALAALLLSALGVPREIVVDDYAYTEVARPDRAALYAAQIEGAGRVLDDVRVFFESPAATMQVALDHLDAEHGSVEAYLTGPAGLLPAQLARLRAALLEA